MSATCRCRAAGRCPTAMPATRPASMSTSGTISIPSPCWRRPSARTVPLPSMLTADGKALDPALFSARQVTLLRLAATDPRVDRIFVNPVIKRALCQGEFSAAVGDRSWLHRLRPWYGHDDHFHVRLACPEGSPDCVRQAPVPAGDGCDASLAWWFQPRQPQPQAAPHPRARRSCPPPVGNSSSAELGQGASRRAQKRPGKCRA